MIIREATGITLHEKKQEIASPPKDAIKHKQSSLHGVGGSFEDTSTSSKYGEYEIRANPWTNLWEMFL